MPFVVPNNCTVYWAKLRKTVFLICVQYGMKILHQIKVLISLFISLKDKLHLSVSVYPCPLMEANHPVAKGKLHLSVSVYLCPSTCVDTDGKELHPFNHGH